MKFYFSLAANNLRKNYRIYLPFLLILTALMMVTLMLLNMGISVYFKNHLFIVSSEFSNNLFIFGSIVLMIMTGMVAWYATSFIMQQRAPEFGLYQVVGFSKMQLAKMLIWENLICWALTLFFGTISGIFCSRLGYLVLARLLYGKRQFNWVISNWTFLIVAGGITLIYLFLQVYASFWLWRHHPLKMMKTTEIGEKELKINWIELFIGLGCLIFGYYLALNLRDSVGIWLFFFGAVLLVIIGTYLLYLAGSTFILKGLQHWHKYYYQPRHFIAIGNLLTRLKQHGAGLASIAILMTMALVTVLITTMIALNTDKMIAAQIPADLVYSDIINVKATPAHTKQKLTRAAQASGVKITRIEHGQIFSVGYAAVDQDRIRNATFRDNSLGRLTQNYFYWLNFLIQDDDLQIKTDDLKLKPDEIILYHPRGYHFSTIKLGSQVFKVKKVFRRYNGIIPNITGYQNNQLFLTFANKQVLFKAVRALRPGVNQQQLADNFRQTYYLTLKGSQEQQIKMNKKIGGGSYSFRLLDRNLFYFPVIYSLLMNGIILSVAFVGITLLILYFKQLSEGYADAKRYATLRRVGLSDQEIKQMIERQLLLMFYLPLLTATMHIIFAFPLINRLLASIGIHNFPLLFLLTFGVLGIFSLLYVAIEHLTGNVYYRIVMQYRQLNNPFFN